MFAGDGAFLSRGEASLAHELPADNRDDVPQRKGSQFLDLIGSVVAAAPADYTQYV
jgi:hypothetical protein